MGCTVMQRSKWGVIRDWRTAGGIESITGEVAVLGYRVGRGIRGRGEEGKAGDDVVWSSKAKGSGYGAKKEPSIRLGC